MATGPMVIIMSASSPKPGEGAAPVPAPPSVCKNNANAAVKIAIHLILNGTRPRSPAKVTVWVHPPAWHLIRAAAGDHPALLFPSPGVASGTPLKPRSCYAALGFSWTIGSVAGKLA